VLLAPVLLVLAAAGLFAAGLAQDSAVLLWSSCGSSVTAALVLAKSAVTHRARSHSPEGRPAGPSSDGARGAVTALGGGVLGASAHRPAAATDTGPVLVAARERAAAGSGPVEPATGAHAVGQSALAVRAGGEPPVEEVAVADLLLVLDLTTDVLVVDEHPRYHLPRCPHLTGAATVPVPMDEARTVGFTPCGTCTPDRVLAERERARRIG
jgi:hypothetical protein